MKTLSQFIIESEIETLSEGLLSKLKGWFKSLFKDQASLNKKSIEVDVKNIKGPEDSAPLKDIEANSEEMKLINNNDVGFPVTSLILKQRKKYLVKEDIISYINLEDKLPKMEVNLVYIENYLTEIANLFIGEEIDNENKFV